MLIDKINIYKGEYKFDKPHGKGTCVWYDPKSVTSSNNNQGHNEDSQVDLSVYQGDWEQGYRQGIQFKRH